MKIVMVSRHNNPYDLRIYHKEARSLTEAGHEVVIVQYLEDFNGLLKSSYGRFRLIYQKSDNKYLDFLKINSQMASVVMDEEPDVIHCHDLETLSAGVRAKKALGVPLVFDAHEDYPTLASQVSYLRGKMWSRIQKKNLPYVDRVITVNEILGGMFEAFDPVILRNYPPLWWAEGLRTDLRKELAPDNETVILDYGNYNKSRKPEMFIEVAKKIRKTHDAKFYSLGPCADGMKIPNNESVKHLGSAPWLNIPDFLLASDIGFCAMNPTPKHRQGIPTRVLECMMFNIPFIANDEFPLVHDLLGDVFCGVPTRFEVAPLVTNLSTLIEDEELRNLLGHAGRKAVETKYNWEREAKKLVHLYDQLEESS